MTELKDMTQQEAMDWLNVDDDGEFQRRSEALAKARGGRLPTVAEVLRGYDTGMEALGADRGTIAIITLAAARATKRIMAENDQPQNGGVSH